MFSIHATQIRPKIEQEIEYWKLRLDDIDSKVFGPCALRAGLSDISDFIAWFVSPTPPPPPTSLPLLVLMGMLGQIRNCSRDCERIFPKFYFYPNLRYWVTANWFLRFSLPRNLCSFTSNYNYAAWDMIVRCMVCFNFIHDHSRSVGEWPRNSWAEWKSAC